MTTMVSISKDGLEDVAKHGFKKPSPGVKCVVVSQRDLINPILNPTLGLSFRHGLLVKIMKGEGTEEELVEWCLKDIQGDSRFSVQSFVDDSDPDKLDPVKSALACMHKLFGTARKLPANIPEKDRPSWELLIRTGGRIMVRVAELKAARPREELARITAVQKAAGKLESFKLGDPAVCQTKTDAL